MSAEKPTEVEQGQINAMSAKDGNAVNTREYLRRLNNELQETVGKFHSQTQNALNSFEMQLQLPETIEELRGTMNRNDSLELERAVQEVKRVTSEIRQKLDELGKLKFEYYS